MGKGGGEPCWEGLGVGRLRGGWGGLVWEVEGGVGDVVGREDGGARMEAILGGGEEEGGGRADKKSKEEEAGEVVSLDSFRDK